MVVDGLSRCLCPSIDSILLASRTSSRRSWPRISRRGNGCKNSFRRPAQAFQSQTRWMQTDNSAPAASASESRPEQPVAAINFGDTINSREQEAHNVKEAGLPRKEVMDLLFNHHVERRATLQHLPYLNEAEVQLIYKALDQLRDAKATDQAIHFKLKEFTKHLMAERGEKPSIRLYEYLVHANMSKDGSGEVFETILKAIDQFEMEPTQSFCQAALRLLAIHPNYILRNSILGHMDAVGIELGDDGKGSVALGLLRDGQYEMAVDYIEGLLENGSTEVAPWVLDIFLYVLARRGFLDETFGLLQKRLQYLYSKSPAGAAAAASEEVNTGEKEVEIDEEILANIPLTLWYFLLDECSRNLHHAGTKFIWSQLVATRGIINPPDGVLANILNTAARAADSQLGTEAIQYLTSRQAKLDAHHYDAFVDCLAYAGELEAALEGLCIRSAAGVPTDKTSTRSIYSLLVHGSRLQAESGIETPEMRSAEEDRAAMKAAAKVLLELGKTKGYAIPAAAMNVLLEAAVVKEAARYRASASGEEAEKKPGRETKEAVPSQTATTEAIEEDARNTTEDGGDNDQAHKRPAAFEMYRLLRLWIAPPGPDMDTFEMLTDFRGAGITDKEDMQFIIDDIYSFIPTQPLSAAVCNNLVHLHVRLGDVDAALEVLDILEKQEAPATNKTRPWLKHDALMALLWRMIKEEDSRVWPVVDEARHRGVNVDHVVRDMLEKQGKLSKKQEATGSAGGGDVVSKPRDEFEMHLDAFELMTQKKQVLVWPKTRQDEGADF